jgi:hypothetical protein
MLSVMRRICRAADIIPESDPRLCFPDCPGFLKTGSSIRDPGFFLTTGTGIRGRTGIGVRFDLVGVLRKIFYFSGRTCLLVGG